MKFCNNIPNPNVGATLAVAPRTVALNTHTHTHGATTQAQGDREGRPYGTHPMVATSAIWLTAILFLATTTFANDAETYTKRGEELFRQNEYGKAITELNQAIQLDPNNAVAYFIRGYAYLNRSEYNQAISDLTQAIQLNSNNPAVYYVRGNAYREKDEHDKACVGKCTPKGNEYSEKAIADFEAVLRLDPDNAEAKEKLGKIRRRTKQ